jgi:hypothetical protein
MMMTVVKLLLLLLLQGGRRVGYYRHYLRLRSYRHGLTKALKAIMMATTKRDDAAVSR